MLVLQASSDTGRAAEKRNSPSSGEDASARASGRTSDLPAPKRRTPSEEARRPLGQEKRHAAQTSVLATDRCFASEQVPFDDSTLSQEPSAHEKRGEEPSAQRTSGQMPSAELEESTKDEGRKEETRVHSAVADRAGEAGPSEARSPTALEILAGSEVAVATAEATRPSSRESPRISVATETLDSEDEDSGLEGQEVESVQGTPTRVLCEQVIPLLRYLDRKAAKELEEKNDTLHRHLTLLRKLQKAVLQLRDDIVAKAQSEFEKLSATIEAELHSERIKNSTLAEKLVRQTRLLEQCQITRKADEELLRRLQSLCDELRAQRVDAELQLVEFEGDNRRATDRTRERLVA
ncbi:hypothetical protein AXG93_3384s2020 [Marchantia polymorpha subsp. ruderalis]|uniref:Uncharacterized protein n=1 Tax=Marchantia polymorpha subsp. ruderalis TaxID=1480154 RepID=A0A176WHU9_MARPO|nr:hypothetical protein AXG93_3384s2020 [Marchantia polymorpha subsp. ruderalis]